MCQNKIVPRFGALLSILVSSACQPIDGIEDGCIRFTESFKSVAVDMSSLDSDLLSKPLPDTLRRLEAGYDLKDPRGRHLTNRCTGRRAVPVTIRALL